MRIVNQKSELLLFVSQAQAQRQIPKKKTLSFFNPFLEWLMLSLFVFFSHSWHFFLEFSSLSSVSVCSEWLLQFEFEGRVPRLFIRKMCVFCFAVRSLWSMFTIFYFLIFFPSSDSVCFEWLLRSELNSCVSPPFIGKMWRGKTNVIRNHRRCIRLSHSLFSQTYKS